MEIKIKIESLIEEAKHFDKLQDLSEISLCPV